MTFSVEIGALAARRAQKRYTMTGLMGRSSLSLPVIAEELEWIEAAAVGL